MHSGHSSSEIVLHNQNDLPKDSISCIKCLEIHGKPNTYRFCVGSFDGSFSIYEANLSQKIISRVFIKNFDSPVTALEAGDKNLIFIGLGDGNVTFWDQESNVSGPLSRHQGPVCKIIWTSALNKLFSFACDKNMKVYNSKQNYQYFDLLLPSTVCAVGYNMQYCVVGFENFTFSFISLKKDINFFNNQFERELNIQQVGNRTNQDQIKCIALNLKQATVRIGTLNGIMITRKFYYAEDQGQVKFNKTPNIQETQVRNNERGMISDMDTGMDPSKGSFTIFVGTFKNYLIYEKTGKNCEFTQKNVPVTCVKMSLDERLIIYATGNDWHRGEEEPKTPMIHIADSGCGY